MKTKRYDFFQNRAKVLKEIIPLGFQPFNGKCLVPLCLVAMLIGRTAGCMHAREMIE